MFVRVYVKLFYICFGLGKNDAARSLFVLFHLFRQFRVVCITSSAYFDSCYVDSSVQRMHLLVCFWFGSFFKCGSLCRVIENNFLYPALFLFFLCFV